MVDGVLAGSCIAAGFGVAASAGVGDAQGQEAVAQRGRFAGGEHQADVGQKQPQRGDHLDEVAILKSGEGLEFTGAGANPRERDSDLCFPAVLEQPGGVGGHGDGFLAPVGQTVQGSDAEAAESGQISPLGCG